MTQVPALEAYRLLAAEYDTLPNPLLALERRTLPRLLPPLEARLVVDVAAGTGYWSAYCAARGARVIAADLCSEMLRRAPRPAVLADAAHLPLPNAIADVAICAFALGYVPGCLAELARITRPGGSVIVSDMHPDSLRRGWTRSFRHAGATIEVAHYPYTLESLTAPGLALHSLLEPCFEEPEQRIFAAAGKLPHFDPGQPAVFVARWTRE